MPQWGWIIIFATGVPLVLIITLVLLKRGGSIGIGKNTLTIPPGETLIVHGDQSEIHTPLGKALHYIPDNIGQIHHLLYHRFLRIVKSKGVAEEDITEIEESVYARMLLRDTVMRGNGSRSVQKIIEAHVARRDFVGKDPDAYVIAHVVPQVEGTLREEINSEYSTTIRTTDGATKTRVVSQVEFIDMVMNRETRELLVKKIVPFFEYAAECMGAG
jgi:hypothetical protein